MSDLKEMLGRKPKEKDPKEKESKLNAIRELKKEAMSMMGDRVKGMMDKPKKVTVAADDSEALKEGLDVASKMVPNDNDIEDLEEETDVAEEVSDDEMTSEEEVAALEEKLAKMKSKLKPKL